MENVRKIRKRRIRAGFWWGNFLENGYLEHRGDMRITLGWTLGK